MQLRYRSVLPLVAVCIALAVAPAFASKPDPASLGTPATSQQSIKMGEIQGAPLCQLGVLGPAANAYGYILPPDDGYYTLLDPASCGSCPGGSYKAVTAHTELFFTAPCEIPVTVTLVQAQQLTPGCWSPNPFAPLCPPTQYMVNDGGQSNVCVDYTLALDPTCCFQGPVFLLIEFDQGTCPTSRPAFCGPAACNLCTQYNFYPGVGVPGDDLCAVLAPFGLFGNVMYADVECCAATPTLPGSWGKLKTTYR
jgi:hypothetical protein